MKSFQTGRAAVSRDDREEFYKALKLSAAGKMTFQMLYFYKYLLKHGEEDNMPLIDKDLFFYIEVQKFKVRVVMYTIKSHKFKVRGTRGFISNFQ